jgi:hypothetical protein
LGVPSGLLRPVFHAAAALSGLVSARSHGRVFRRRTKRWTGPLGFIARSEVNSGVGRLGQGRVEKPRPV